MQFSLLSNWTVSDNITSGIKYNLCKYKCLIAEQMPPQNPGEIAYAFMNADNYAGIPQWVVISGRNRYRDAPSINVAGCAGFPGLPVHLLSAEQESLIGGHGEMDG
jgi:hypothetical protein